MPAGLVAAIERNPAWARRFRWGLVAFILLAGAAVGIKRGSDTTKFDFRCFYKDAEAIASGTDLTKSSWLEWYLPGFRIALAPLGHHSIREAAVIWNGINLLAAIVALSALTHCMLLIPFGASPARTPDARAEFDSLFAFMLAAPLIFFNFQCNQISLWPLAALSLAMLAAMRKRWVLVGAWLGLAIFIKVLPALLLGWCLLRRRFVSAIVALVVPVALTLGIDAAANGRAAAWRHHMHWYQVAVSGSSGAAFVESGRNLRHENQGLAAILARLLQPQATEMASPLSPELDRPMHPVNVASLSAGTIRGIYRAIVVISLLSLAYITLRAPRNTTVEFGLFAIWCIAIMWFAPLARQYYEVWALPALCFLADRWWRHRAEGSSAAVCTAATIAWIVGLVGWAVPELRAIGINQWVNLAIMAAVATEMFATATPASAEASPVR